MTALFLPRSLRRICSSPAKGPMTNLCSPFASLAAAGIPESGGCKKIYWWGNSRHLNAETKSAAATSHVSVFSVSICLCHFTQCKQQSLLLTVTVPGHSKSVCVIDVSLKRIVTIRGMGEVIYCFAWKKISFYQGECCASSCSSLKSQVKLFYCCLHKIFLSTASISPSFLVE